MKPAYLRWAVALAALAAAAVLTYRLMPGARYRLYTSAVAGDCWRAIELTTLPTSTITPVAVASPTQDADGRTRVSIDYTMDRVLGGKMLNVSCLFSRTGELASVDFEGVALDPDTLAEVNRELGN